MTIDEQIDAAYRSLRREVAPAFRPVMIQSTVTAERRTTMTPKKPKPEPKAPHGEAKSNLDDYAEENPSHPGGRPSSFRPEYVKRRPASPMRIDPLESPLCCVAPNQPRSERCSGRSRNGGRKRA
jgi:hypothetical protein